MKSAKLIKTKAKKSSKAKVKKPVAKKIIIVIEAPISEEPIEIPKSARVLRIEAGG